MGKKNMSSNHHNQTENTPDLEKCVKKMVAEAVNLWKTEYLHEINALKVELLELKSSQEFVCSKYESLKSEYEKLLQTNRKQESEIISLKEQSTALENKQIKDTEKLDAVEQYGRRQNLEIKGVPIVYGEDTNKIVVEVAKSLNVDISTDDISTSHRLPVSTKSEKNDDSTSTPIIVRFVSRDVRNKIYANRKLTRQLDMKKFGIKGTTKLFINENLTLLRKRLFWKTKQKVKEAGYKYIWTSNGNIFVRKVDEANPIAVNSEKDLNLIQ